MVFLERYLLAITGMRNKYGMSGSGELELTDDDESCRVGASDWQQGRFLTCA